MLTVYYPNYSEIKRNSHLFLKNPKWLPNTSYNIYPMMHCNCCCFLWGIDLLADEGVDLPNLKSSSPQEVCTGGVDLPADLGVDLPNLNSSWPKDVGTSGVDLPVYLSIWTLTLQMWICYSSPLDVSTGGRSASRSANMNSNIHITC